MPACVGYGLCVRPRGTGSGIKLALLHQRDAVNPRGVVHTEEGKNPLPADRWSQETVMEHQRTGRLYWDTTHAATPGWLLFLDAQPEDLLTMRPWLETRLPADAMPAAITHLLEELLQRDTGHRPAEGRQSPYCPKRP
jgi:hypothetical protein